MGRSWKKKTKEFEKKEEEQLRTKLAVKLMSIKKTSRSEQRTQSCKTDGTRSLRQLP